MNILIIGASGQIGSELVSRLRGIGTLITPSRSDMDLTIPDQIRQTIRTAQPDLIINTAAYTNVEGAESALALAMQINGEAPAVIAQEAHRAGAALLHYSTDYVFDGEQTTPYFETDTPRPLNAYGRSKLAGEHGVARYSDNYWILRCSWVYSAQGNNFLNTMWRLMQERDELRVVADQTGAPTWARSIAGVSADMLGAMPDRQLQEVVRSTTGIYHLSAAGATSWHGMALSVLRRMQAAGVPTRVTEETLLAVPTSGYPSAACRPRMSCLAPGKLRDVFQLSFAAWEDDLERCIDELITQQPHPAGQAGC